MLHKTRFYLSVICCGVLLCGCGTTKSRSGTEQLLVSDAVDRAVARIDFSPLAGSTVFLDTQYVKSVKGAGFVNADYIVSSLRQQMLAANCFLEENKNTAEYVAEVRIGALGADAHNVTYGIPASNSLSTAAALVPNAPSIPMVPEISLAKKEDEVAAAKIVVFAYDRETRQAVWQSGIAQARSTSKDLWLFGAGPFQSGSIHEVPQFAGEDIEIPLLSQSSEEHRESLRAYGRDIRFVQPRAPLIKTRGKVLPASHEKEVAPPKATKVPAKTASKPKGEPAKPAAE